MDFVLRVPHIPVSGETVLGSRFEMFPGGKGANQACAAGRLAKPGTDVRMIGRTGYDVFADHLKASLAAAGVNVAGVHACQTQATGVAMIWVDATGENSIAVAPGANAALSPGDAESHRPAFRGASVALFQLESPLETVEALLKIAREEGVRTILDPAPARPLEREFLQLADVLTPNETEAAVLTGLSTGHSSAGTATRLQELGAATVVLKLGPQGCFFQDDAGAGYPVPGFAVDTIDTTAAGDTFNGALSVALAEGRSWAEALRFANAAAALSVTRLGAQSSIPTRAETDAYLVKASRL